MSISLQTPFTKIAAEAAIFTEGDPEKWSEIVSLGHLPVFVD